MPDTAQRPTASSSLSVLQMTLLPLKLLSLGVIFLTGCLSIVYTQFLAKTFVKDDGLQRDVMEFTKRNFVILLTFMTRYFSSSSILSLSFNDEEQLKKSVILKGNNTGKLMLNPNAIIIANHQIYSDWLYLWFIAYLNNCHDHIFIIMKDSLKKLPILGYGMSNYNFVFLSRKWENDFLHMKTQFSKICTLSNKAWMLIFPEGTNINNDHLIKSKKYAEQVGGPIMRTVLLPRVKGLYLGLKELSPVTSSIIDFTVGYSDHKVEEQAQDIFTLKKIFVEGQSPRRISILVNQYDMKKEIPEIQLTSVADDLSTEQEEKEMEVLTKWIYKIWAQKDKDMEYYYEHGNFGKPTVDIPLKLRNPFEILLVYLIPVISFIVFYLAFKFYQLLFNLLI